MRWWNEYDDVKEIWHLQCQFLLTGSACFINYQDVAQTFSFEDGMHRETKDS